MREIIAMLFVVLIVTMPLAAAQSEYSSRYTPEGYSRLISSGGGLNVGADNYVGEPINIYVDHYEPTVLTTNLIEQDDVPVFVFLRGNTLGSFLGFEGNLGEPYYGTPQIRDINPRVVGGSKYVRSVQYVPPSQLRMDFGNRYYDRGISAPFVDLAGAAGTVWDATMRGFDSNFRGVASTPKYSSTNDLNNLGMLVVRLARIPKEADVPDAIELNISANVYFNTERSLSFQRWEMELDEQPDARKWLGDRRPLLGEEGFGRNLVNWGYNLARGTDIGSGGAMGIDSEVHKGNAFFYGQGYLRAEDIGSGEATLAVYDGYFNEIGKSILKIGEESRYYSLRGTYGDRNDRVKFRLNDVFDPRKKRVDVDIVRGNMIQRVKLFEKSRIYPGSSWIVNSIDIDGRKARVELINDLGERFTLTANLAKAIDGEEKKKQAEAVGEDPCLNMNSVTDSEFNAATETDLIKLYCSAIAELRKIIRNYGNVPTGNNMDNIENEKNYADVARWRISEAYLKIAKLLSEEGKEEDARVVYEVAREEARYINNPALLSNIESQITSFGLFGTQKIDSKASSIDDFGERISIQIREVWGESFGGVPSVINGERVSLTVGNELKTSGYVVTEFNDDKVWLSTETVKVYEWEKKVGVGSSSATTNAILDITGMAVSSVRGEDNYDGFITQYSEEYGVPFALIKAVIRKESSFNPNALSVCSAAGLMQLVRETAEKHGGFNVPNYGFEKIENTDCTAEGFTSITKCYSKNDGSEICDKDKKNQDLRFDPEENIKTGTNYLKTLLNGNNDASIRVALKTYGDGTDTYVNKVMEFYEFYKKLSEEPTTEEPTTVEPTTTRSITSSNSIPLGCITETGRKKTEVCSFETKEGKDVTFFVSLDKGEVKIERKNEGKTSETRTIKERETGYFSDLKDGDGIYRLNFNVEDIQDDGTVDLLITKIYEGSSEGRKSYQRGQLTHSFMGLDGQTTYRVVFEKSSSDRKAYVSVISGREDVRGVSDFYLRIPIEKRPFNLTNEQIDSYLDQTNSTIQKLDSIITSMDKILETWRTICVSTHLFIVAKNLFFGGNAGAREAVMEGYAGEGGWKDHCLSKVGTDYGTYDECIFANEKEINDQIESFDKYMKAYNRDLKRGKGDITKTKFYSDLKNKEDYSFLENAEENGQIDLVLGDISMAQLLYYESLGDEGRFVEKRNELRENLKNNVNNYEKAVEAANNCRGDNCPKDEKGKKDLIESAFISYNTLEVRKGMESQKISFDKIVEAFNKVTLEGKNKNIGELGGIRELAIADISKTGGNAFYIDRTGGTSKYVQLVPVKNREINEDFIKPVVDVLTDTGQILFFNPDAIGTEKDLTFQIAGRSLYKNPEGTEFYIVLEERNVGLGTEYDFPTDSDKKVAQFYPDGKPFCIPYPETVSDGTNIYTKGVFLKVLNYKDDGRPENIQLRNVGPDGEMCTGDDIMILHDSVLNPLRREYAAQYHRIVNYLVGKNCKPGKRITIPNRGSFKCNSGAYNRAVGATGTHCTDVMSTGDCKLMFNVCDPVMCPRSRFNLGGQWYVDDVVQSGMIGSLVLGLDNWGSGAQIVPPVCFTGISASLKNIKSIFEGAQQCLITAKEKGESVGICDKIRNMFVCEVVWREGVSALSAIGGFLGGKKDIGEGGGEYLNFQNSFDNAGQSLNYFVNEYATSSTQSYKSRNLVEFGTEICKSAMHQKIPGIGDIVQQLARPSDPAQFTAFMSITPYSQTADASTYSVFYQIYAGTNQNPYTGFPGVTYSVYMLSDNGDVYHVTDGLCDRVSRANIPAGGQAIKNVDCVAPEGFNQLCVDIDGKRECGFGRVSSSFSINWLNDQSVKSEVNKKIDSEEECVPDKNSGLGDIITGTGTGVVRVCSVNPPGGDNWKPIGTCGVDKQKVNLGTCWVDEQTIDIKHEGDAKTISDALNKNLEDYRDKQLAEMMGISVGELMKKEKSEEEFKKALVGTSYEKLGKLREFLRTSISPDHIARALYEISRIYLEKADGFLKKKVEELSKDGEDRSEEDSSDDEVDKLTQCNDGDDNDDDGLKDLQDPGCDDPSDNDESVNGEETLPTTFDGLVKREIFNLKNPEKRTSSISKLIELSKQQELAVGYNLITNFEESQEEESNLREGILMVLEETAPFIRDTRLKESIVSLLGIVVGGRSQWETSYTFEISTSIQAAKVLGKIGDSDSKKHLKDTLLTRKNDELFNGVVSSLRDTGAQGFFKLIYEKDELSSGDSPLRIYKLGFAVSPDSYKDQAYTYLNSQNEFGMYVWSLDEIKWIIFDTDGFFVNDISDLAVYMRDYYSTSTLKGRAGTSRFVGKVSQLVPGIDSSKLWNLVNSEYFYDLVKYAYEKGNVIGVIY